MKTFEGELNIDQEKCQSCGACVDICPANVLSFPASSKPGKQPEKVMSDENYCIYCGACDSVCPVDAIEVKRTGIKHTPTKSKSWEKKIESLKT